MEIEYVGEHLVPGKLGHFFVILSFVGALFAAISYFISANKGETETSWRNLGRALFASHAIAVFGIIGTLFYMLVNHMFEYHYIWNYSNTEMQMRYILSSFWGGQEGSFLLWTFWHVLLGSILIFTAKKWEASVMATFSLVQAFLASMLLGYYLSETVKIGSDPFMLLREHPDFANLPFIQNPNYLASIDGRGLNPSLQNYWMTIHPPTLFLGFASTLIPFAYAIAGLWKKQYNEWLKPALPWAFFGVMILGTGILMGGAWAYEALSFGGFWAWDPVENASLVPWLTFVGAAHVMLINKNRGQSLLITFILTFLTFILVLYSTFLTRSGVLGETSVHAFTEMGMSAQLLIYLFSFIILSTLLLIFNWKHFPKKKEEESIWSREFWMFVGAIVLLASAFQIIVMTSIPVINKVFGTELAPPLDEIGMYNSWQANFAILVALLIAIGQFFKYKKTDPKKFLKSITFSLVLSLVLSIAFAVGIGMMDTLLHLTGIKKFDHALAPFNVNLFVLLWTASFAVLANIEYFIRILKGKIRLGGASIAHVGFALILVGALVSNAQKQIISQNTSDVDLEKLGNDFPNGENIMLKLNDTLQMGDYLVTYTGREKEGVNFYYSIDYLEKNDKGQLEHSFTLKPIVQTNPQMGNIAEPATKHYLHKDVYTHITYADLSENNGGEKDNYREPVDASFHIIRDTVYTSNGYILLEGFNKNLDEEALQIEPKDIAIGLRMKAVDHKGGEHYAEPIFIIRGNRVVRIPAEFDELGIKVDIEKVVPEEGRFDFKIAEKNKNFSEFIIMKAIVFPFINILWAGCLIMVIGTILAIRHRIKTS